MNNVTQADIPTVWVLTDDRPGNTTQSIGLARALGWPYQVKELQFTPIVHKVKFFWNSFTATTKWVDPTRSSSLTRRGIARFFGGPLEIWPSPALREIDEVAARVKKQLGY